MFELQGKIPKKINIGFSGGVDSMAAFDFLVKRHDVTLIYVNHGDAASEQEIPYLIKVSNDYNVSYQIHDRVLDIPKGESREHFWSKQRKDVFFSLSETVILCHHLNDCMETWAVSSMQGKPAIIPYQTQNIIRPFRLNPKQEFVSWCERHDLEWIEDQTNHDQNYAQRNFVRNVLMQNILQVNPGYEKTVKNLVRNDFNQIS